MAATVARQFPISRSLGLLIVAAVLFPVHGQSVPEPNRERLLNGLTVLFWQRPGDPNVLLKLRIQSGAAFDLAGKGGTMALLGEALFPDPATREYVSEQLGGRLEISTDYDAIDVTISGKIGDLERMVDLLRNAVVATQLSNENVSKVRQARIDELAKRTASPSEIADQAIASRLFGAYPYGHPASGTLDSLAKVDRADLLLAHDRFLNADNATVAIVGGVEKTRLMRALRQLLGPWQKSDRTIPATFRQPNAPDSRVLLISQLQAKSAEIRLAVRGLARSDRDLAAASMLAQIVRERWQSAAPDLSSAFVRHEAHALPGMFVLGASAPAGSAGKAIASAQEIMRSLAQNGPTPAETERARSAVLAAISKRAAQPDAVVDSWLDSETYKLGQIDNQTAAVGGVTAADVQRVATKLFKDAPQAAVVVGDADQLKSALGSSVEFRSDKLKTKTASEPPPPPKKP